MGLFGPPNPTSLRVKGNVKKLIKLLFYKDPDIREEAMTQLRYLDDKSEIDVIAENLIRVLKEDQSNDVRASAAAALKDFPHPTTIEPLVNALFDSETSYAASLSLETCLKVYERLDEEVKEKFEIEDETFLKIKKALSDMSKKEKYDDNRVRIIIGLYYMNDARVAPILKEQLDLSEKIHKKRPTMGNANILDNCREALQKFGGS